MQGCNARCNAGNEMSVRGHISFRILLVGAVTSNYYSTCAIMVNHDDYYPLTQPVARVMPIFAAGFTYPQ